MEKMQYAPREYVDPVLSGRRAARERETIRRLRNELAHLNRISTLGELSASLSHELKQPIAAAIANAEACLQWLVRDQPDLQEMREAATQMINEAKRAADIIDSLRSFYKKDTPPERQLVDVNGILVETCGLLQKEATRFCIAMRTDLSTGLPPVMANPVQLQQVFMNLMLNGIEAMRDATGEVIVKSGLGKDESLLVSVSDTGIGLPVKHVNEIFSAFFTTKQHGSGMGLPICRSIVDAHGGYIWATDNLGPGATFHVLLPIQATTS